MKNVDLIIIGAGSSGCVSANILSKNKNLRILILEAGPSDFHPMIKVPLGYGMTFYNKSINWNFFSTIQKNLNNRLLYCPRGKVVGGSSSINAMVYTRGFKTDFKNWSYDHSSLWSWEKILNTYENMEKNIFNIDTSSAKEKIIVNDVSSQHHKILQNYFEGTKDLGIPFVKSFNTINQQGVGHYDITSRNGYRWSAADAFLKETLKKDNINLITKANVQELIIKDHKVLGVKYSKNNKVIEIKANVGVIMAAGSIKTPHILMNSGIGPSKLLKKNDISIKIENNNVGSHLQDHIGIDYLYKSKIPTLNQSLGTIKGRIQSILQYLFFRNGPLSLSINQGGGFIRWKNKEDYPNLQIYFNPLTYSVNYKNKRPLLQTDKFNGFIIGFNSCRPKSRGVVTLKSNNINDDPIIDPQYLSHEDDIYDLECAYDFVRKLSNTKPIKEIVTKPVNIDPLKFGNKEMTEHFKNNASSVFHPCGTCRIGSSEKIGVVSNRLKIYSMENLWIVDASVLPNVTSGNINAPVMMTAYNGSNIIAEDINKLR